MPDLLHEYWVNAENSAQFGVVRAYNDEVRATMAPGSKLMFSLHASSWHQAMKLCQEQLGYDYHPPKDVPNLVYTEAEKAEQQAYLAVRKIG